MSAYFVPSQRFRKALRGAARRGVDVRLLVPGPLTDHPWVRHAARRFYGKLLRNGVRIFEFQTRVLHGKMTICDDWVSVGSSNLDRWSFKWNLEANQEIDNAAFAHSAAAGLREGLPAIAATRSAQLAAARMARSPAGALGRLARSVVGAVAASQIEMTCASGLSWRCQAPDRGMFALASDGWRGPLLQQGCQARPAGHA